MKHIFLILFVVVFLASCKKSRQVLPVDNGCISHAYLPDYNIKPADSVTAIGLLSQNNIPHTNITLSYFSSYTVTDGEAPGTYSSVFVTQHVNGLPILSGDVWYQFKNNVLQSTGGTLYNSINLNVYPHLTLPELRAAYFISVNKNGTAQLAAALKDSCLIASFGYYDLNVNVGSAPNFVKAWTIMPEHGGYPHVFVSDDNSAEIIYDGGIHLDNTHTDHSLAPTHK